jgi:hypothetical protein
VLYITANDKQPFGCVCIAIPYSQLIEIPEIQKEDHWKVIECLEQVFITMPEGNQVEVRGVINMNACVLEQCKIRNVKEITAEAYYSEEFKKRPGMLIHFVQPKETLWDISKKNGSTMEEIRRINELATEEVLPGQKLLLIKSNVETLLS